MIKFWLDSKTVRATLVQVMPVIVLILQAFGIDILPNEADTIVNGLVAIVSLGAIIYAIYGRSVAQGAIVFDRKEVEGLINPQEPKAE